MTALTDEERLPVRVDTADIDDLEAAVGTFRALDYRLGGGYCRDALRVLKTSGRLLRRGLVPEHLRARLCTALADTHNLLGWTEFDAGNARVAQRRFERALELATEADNDDLVANVCYRLGRLHLHYHAVGAAMADFARGQEAARRAGSALAKAILSANEAWAFALCGNADEALANLSRAADEFADSRDMTPAPWAAFFGANDLAAMAGTVLTELARTVDTQHGARAIPELTKAIEGYGPEMARSRSLTLIWLAVCHALAGDLDAATGAGAEAIELARGLRSARTRDRLWPLDEAVRRHGPSPRGGELLELIGRFRMQPAW
ncbi:hypothetical protein [Amycolatopsis sp. NPDC059021]|uniref:hypothetical protein n=1 Tax=Amycolatopsis sp. NPDC059021 TaxID=3346704 RepID=UPI003671A68B